MFDRLAALEQRFQQLEEQMAQPEVAADYERLQALARERAALEDTVTLYRRYRQVTQELADTEALARDGDQEMAALAREEVERLRGEKERLEQELRLALLPRDPNDERDVIVEIRAGVGGEEAALFAADLYRMYTRYAQRQGWSVELVDASPSERGGFKEVVFQVHGKGAFSRLKYERGVHRVQRVPVTEAAGRIHTSTVSVAVLPEAEEVDVHLNPNDLRIDIFHSGGHGGQNVQKVATAVRIVHIPTGITAVCQDERSQLKNKEKAMAVLRARLYEAEQRRQEEAQAAERRSQVGTMERAEKVRTYNFPQDRMTDHRIGMSVHGLPRILDGELQDVIDALATHEQQRLLAEATGGPLPARAGAADDE